MNNKNNHDTPGTSKGQSDQKDESNPKIEASRYNPHTFINIKKTNILYFVSSG